MERYLSVLSMPSLSLDELSDLDPNFQVPQYDFLRENPEMSSAYSSFPQILSYNSDNENEDVTELHEYVFVNEPRSSSIA